MEIPDPILAGGATAVFGGIAVILKTLFLRITEAADKCETDRKLLWEKVRDLELRLDDCPASDCPIRPRHPHPPGPIPSAIPTRALPSS